MVGRNMGSSGEPDLQTQLEHLAGDIFHIHRVEQWIILTSNDFDLQIPDLPPFQSLNVLYHCQTQEFICRTFGRCLEKGSFESLEQLAKFTQETFQRKSACIGSGDFPESSVFSKNCAKYAPSKISSRSSDCKSQLPSSQFRCDSCQKELDKSKSPLNKRPSKNRNSYEVNTSSCDPEVVSPKEEFEALLDDYELAEHDDDKSDGGNISELDLFKTESPAISAKLEVSLTEVDDVVADIKDENNPTISIFGSDPLPKRKRGRPPKNSYPPKSESSGTEDNNDYIPRKKRKTTKSHSKHSNSGPGPDGKFKCEFCDHTVTTLSGQHSHKKLNHGWGRFACELCPTMHKVAKEFIRHMKDVHVGVSEAMCPQCKQRVDFEEDEQVFEGHYLFCVRSNRMNQNAKLLAQKPPNKPERIQCTCDTCGRTFHTLQRLKVHQRIHEGKGFMCKDCGFWASHKSILKAHMQKHEREKGTAMELVCPHCAFVCLGQTQYNTHMKRRHRPFQCTQCPEVCLGKRLLNIHMSEVHGANRCDVCAMCFTSNDILRRHKLIHSEPSFRCRFCPKMFKAQRCLANHERTHTGETPFKCALCDVKFKTTAALSLHKKTRHNGGQRLRKPDDEVEFFP